jgi:hypothetical protein
MGAVAAGRLGTTTVFVVLPLLAQAAARMLTTPPRSARRAAWATGLLTAIAAAFVPLVWVIVAGLVLVLLAARRWAWPVSLLNAAIVIVAPFLVLFPWSLNLLTRPSSFLLEAGLTRPGLSAASLRPSSLLLMHPGGPGLPPAWVTASLALALVSLALTRRTGLVAAGWLVAVAGFAAALAVSRSTVVPDGGGSAVSAWPGAALAIAALGLLIAAAPAADWLASGLRAADPEAASARPEAAERAGRAAVTARPPRALAVLALIVAVAGPVAAGGSWVWTGVRGPVATVSSPVLPAFVAASSVGGTRYRTLVLREDGGVLTYYVLRQGDPTLGEPELAGSAPAEQVLARQVAALAAPNGADGGDPAQVLGEFGIRWVVLPGPVDDALAQRLDAAAGLVPVSSAPAYDLWQVAGPVARVRVLGPDGAVSVLHSDVIGASAVHAPSAGGTLVLAEPAGGWKATLDGRALTAQAKPFDGWAQAFTLPAGGGRLVVTHDDMARDLSLFAELVVFLAVCVLALPGKRTDPAAEAAALAALQAARRGKRAAQSDRAEEPEGQDEEDAVPLGSSRRPGHSPSRARGRRAEPPSRVPGRRVASSPGVAAVTEADPAPASRVGVLADSGSDGGKAGTSGWAAAAAGKAARGGAGTGEADRGADAGRRPGEPARRPGRDNGSDWSDILAERDSGAWPAVSGGRTTGAPLATEANDAWRSDSGSGWDTGADSGSTDSWATGRSGPRPRVPERTTGGQPWQSLGAAPRAPFESADAARPATAPQLAATRSADGAGTRSADGAGTRSADGAGTRSADGNAREAKPAERHSHRAPGRHGRPARRIWDRAGKDKDKDE